MAHTYTRQEQADGSILVIQHRSDGHARSVSDQHREYRAWCDAGNVAPLVPYKPPPEPPVAEKWRRIRERRERLWPFVDWVRTSPSPSARCKAAVAAYAQSLADITEDFANPDDVVWPRQPAYEKAT